MTRQIDTCACGEPAVWYMDPDGDPLPRPMCNDCFVYWVSTTWEPETDEEEGDA